MDPFDVPVETELPPAPDDVVFTPSGGGFVGTTSVALSTPAGAHEIHYTTDGTLPTRDSELYVGPVQLSQTTLVRAVSVSSDGTMQGPAMAQTFVALSPDAASFSSTLPIVRSGETSPPPRPCTPGDPMYDRPRWRGAPEAGRLPWTLS